jgi:predicted nucleic acid-binding protein
MKTGFWGWEHLIEKKRIDEAGLVDTNILFYLIDATEPKKHEKAKEFLGKIKENPSNFVISAQNIREFTSITFRKAKKSGDELLSFLFLFQESFGIVLNDTIQDVYYAISLVLHYQIPFWDALLASTMKRNKIRVVYTENVRDFGKMPGIRVINPVK